MNEEEFQGQLDKRVNDLKSAGEPAEKIQEWIDSQWAEFDADGQGETSPTEQEPISDELEDQFQQVDAAPIQEQVKPGLEGLPEILPEHQTKVAGEVGGTLSTDQLESNAEDVRVDKIVKKADTRAEIAVMDILPTFEELTETDIEASEKDVKGSPKIFNDRVQEITGIALFKDKKVVKEIIPRITKEIENSDEFLEYKKKILADYEIGPNSKPETIKKVQKLLNDRLQNSFATAIQTDADFNAVASSYGAAASKAVGSERYELEVPYLAKSTALGRGLYKFYNQVEAMTEQYGVMQARSAVDNSEQEVEKLENIPVDQRDKEFFFGGSISQKDNVRIGGQKGSYEEALAYQQNEVKKWSTELTEDIKDVYQVEELSAILPKVNLTDGVNPTEAFETIVEQGPRFILDAYSMGGFSGSQAYASSYWDQAGRIAEKKYGSDYTIANLKQIINDDEVSIGSAFGSAITTAALERLPLDAVFKGSKILGKAIKLADKPVINSLMKGQVKGFLKQLPKVGLRTGAALAPEAGTEFLQYYTEETWNALGSNTAAKFDHSIALESALQGAVAGGGMPAFVSVVTQANTEFKASVDLVLNNSKNSRKYFQVLANNIVNQVADGNLTKTEAQEKFDVINKANQKNNAEHGTQTTFDFDTLQNEKVEGLAKNTFYSPDESSQIEELRSIAGVKPDKNPTSSSVESIRSINQHREIGGKKLTQAEVQGFRPTEAVEANQADIEQANNLAAEYAGKTMPNSVKTVINELIGNVENRNNNNQRILGEHSSASLEKLDGLQKTISGYSEVLNDPNISEDTKSLIASKKEAAEFKREEAYYAPLVRDQKRDEYKEESRDEFTRLDEINNKLADPNVTPEQKKNLTAQRQKYYDEIAGKQADFQETDPSNPQNIQDEIRNIQDRRLNPRQVGEPRGNYKNRITRETNNALGKVFSQPGLSGVQKSRATTALLANNAGFVNKQVQNFKRKSQGTNFASAFTSDDFKAAMETQMIKNAETFKEGKGAKFGTRALSGVKEKAWNIAKKQQAAIRDKSRKTWGQNTEQLQDTSSGSKSVEETFDVTKDDEQSDDGPGDEYGSYDPSESFERADITEGTQKLLNFIHELTDEMVEAFDTDIANEIASGVDEGALNIMKGEGQLITKLNKRVRKPMLNHLNQLWGKSVADQLSYLEDNWQNLNAIIPIHARNGKFLDGLFTDPDVALSEVTDYMQADSDKNNKVRLRKLKNALVERMTDVALDRVLRNNPDLLLFKPDFQLNADQYVDKRERRDTPIDGLNDRLNAAWAGTGLNLVNTQEGYDQLVNSLKNLKTSEHTAGFQIANLVAINPRKAKADTQLHELAHVFMKAMKKLDPKQWEIAKNLIKDSDYLNEIKNHKGYQKAYGPFESNPDRYYEEAIVTAIGREGSELFAEKSKQGKWDKFVHKFKQWFSDMFGIGYDPKMTLQDFIKNTSIDIIQGNGIIRKLKADPTLLGQRKIFAKKTEINKEEEKSAKQESPEYQQIKAQNPSLPDSVIRNLAANLKKSQDNKKAKGVDSKSLGKGKTAAQQEYEKKDKEIEEYKQSAIQAAAEVETMNQEAIGLGYDPMKTVEKVRLMIGDFTTNKYPELQNVTWTPLTQNYPKEVAEMAAALEALGAKDGMKSLFGNWDSRKPGVGKKNNKRDLDAAINKKLKDRESTDSIVHAINEGDGDVRKLAGIAFSALNPSARKKAEAELAAARISNMIGMEIHELPPAVQEAFLKDFDVHDPAAMTYKGQKINLTQEGGWSSSDAQVKVLAETISELARWPKKLKDIYLENMKTIVGQERDINPAFEIVQRLERYKNAIVELRENGSMTDIQAKLALKAIEDASVDQTIGHKTGPTAKGFGTKKTDFGVDRVFNTIISGLNIVPSVIQSPEISAILDVKKSNGDSAVMQDTNDKNYLKNETNQKNKEKARIQHSLDKQVILKEMITNIADAVNNGRISLETGWRMNWLMWHNQASLGRSAAPRTHKDLNADLTRSQSFTVEHIQPTETTKTMAFASALNGDRKSLDAVFDGFFIVDLEKNADEYMNLGHIGLSNKVPRGVFDSNFKPLGNIPGTTVPYQIIRYFNTQGSIDLFKLQSYLDNKSTFAKDLSFPPAWEAVFSAITKGGAAEYGGIAYQLAENAVERNVLKVQEGVDSMAEFDQMLEDNYADFQENGGDIDPMLFNEAERQNISYQLNETNFEDQSKQEKVNTIKDFISQKFEYAGGKGDKIKTKIDAAARNKLEAYQNMLENNGDILTNDDLRHIWAEAKEIVKTGKSTTIARAKVMQEKKDQMAKDGDKFISDITGVKGEVTANQATAQTLAKKTWLQKLSNAREGSKLYRLLAPRSNNDFFGLMYDLLPSGGDRAVAKAFQEENLIDPLNDANWDYGEARFGMQTNQSNALAELGGSVEGKSEGSLRRQALKAKERLQKPNSAGITIDGQVVSDAQIIRTFNHLKDPSMHASIKETIPATQLKEIVDYMTLSNPDLLAFSKKTLDNYSASSADTHHKMASRGFKGVNRYRISEKQRQDPLLQQIYGVDGVPTYAPYSPVTYSIDHEGEFGDMFGPGENPYTLMTDKLKKREVGGKYQMAGQDVFSDLQQYVGPSGPLRTAAFLDFAQNMSGFLSKENLNKARTSNKLGSAWVSSVQGSMRRIITGKNRPAKLGKTEAVFYDWMNGSIAAVMFFNTRSAVLQFLSTTNYMVQNPDAFFGGIYEGVKNPKAMKRAWRAMARSAWFNERGKGATMLEMEEIFSQGDKKVLGSARIGKILKTSQKYGYSMTKLGDKGAIALGGAPFVAGKIAKYEKQGMTAAQAELQAVKDFVVAAEEAQQSSRAERLGEEQTGKFGRMILAFANTPQQYNRLMSRSLQDLNSAIKTRDPKAAAHAVAKVAYFGMIQNAMFSFLQGALFKAIGEEEEDEKINQAANSMLDTILRGSGIYGALGATIKNLAIARIKRGEWDKADVFKTLINTSPALGSKFGQVNNVVKSNIYGLSDSEYSTQSSDIYRVASAVNVITNIPADRILKKYEALADLAADDLDNFDKTLRAAGWDRYTLGESTGETVEDSDNLEDMREFFEEVFEDYE